jgi:hypothetical protein
LSGRFDRVLARKPPPGTIEAVPIERTEEILVRLHRLLDVCWEGHLGYASLDLTEFAEVFRGALSIMKTGNVHILVDDGHDVGFTLIYPDYADDVRALDGDATGWGRWLGEARPDRFVLHTEALAPSVRASSAATAMLAAVLRQALAGGYQRIVVALAVEGFVSKIGEQTREYALYGYTK